jgi:chorismate mutase
VCRLDSLHKTLEAGIDSMEKRLSVVQELAEIKARLAEVEKRNSAPLARLSSNLASKPIANSYYRLTPRSLTLLIRHCFSMDL